MKIALICGNFVPELSYQEVALAKSFGKIGNQIRVFTSTKVSKSARKFVKKDYDEGLSVNNEFKIEIHRLRPFFAIRSIILVKNICDKIIAYNPDLIILTSIGKLLPAQVFRLKDRYRIVTIYGESSDNRNRINLFQNLISDFLNFGFRIVKSRFYIKSLIISKKLFFNLPETKDLINSFSKNKYKRLIDEKSIIINLGYDDSIFNFNEEDRITYRNKLNISENTPLFITFTKVSPVKEIKFIIDNFITLAEKGIDFKYLIIGLLNDTYSKYLTDYINSTVHKDKFILMPFLHINECIPYLSAADYSIWKKPTITILESMGTGLPAIIPDIKGKYHFIKERVNGWFYNDNNIQEILGDIINTYNKMDLKEKLDNKRMVIDHNYKNISGTSIARIILYESSK